MRQFPNTYDSTQHIYYCINKLRFYKDYIRRYERLIKEDNIIDIFESFYTELLESIKKKV